MKFPLSSPHSDDFSPYFPESLELSAMLLSLPSLSLQPHFHSFSDPLPPCLAFLKTWGLPFSFLYQIMQEAKLQNISPEQALFASGGMEEEIYYRYFAYHIGLSFIPLPPPFKKTARFHSILHCCFAKLDSIPHSRHPSEDKWIMAPTGPSLDILLQLSHQDTCWSQKFHKSLFLTSPSCFRKEAQNSFRDHLKREASFGLTRQAPSLCAHQTFKGYPQEKFFLIGGVSLLLFFLHLPHPFHLLMTLPCSFLFIVTSLLRLYCLFKSPSFSPPLFPLIPSSCLPIYTIIVPLYQETRILPHLLSRLARLDYPKAKLDIKFVIEESDQAMQQALTSSSLPYGSEIVIAPQGFPRTKPRALNIALSFARGTLLTVYDAEDDPDPHQLKLAASRFASCDETIGCLQAHLCIDNVDDSWLSALFGLEYAALFDVLNPALSHHAIPLFLGGTSNHFRISALREIGAWDAWNVTEDIDLSFRLSRAGWRIETLPSSTYEEAPRHLKAWISQRQRWMKGWMQTFLTHTRSPTCLIREMGARPAWTSLALLMNGLLGPLLGPFFLFQLGLHLRHNPLFSSQDPFLFLNSLAYSLIFLCGAACSLLPILIGAQKRKLKDKLYLVPLLPLYYGLISLATWKALLELLSHPFFWAKTEHGLAKTSRRRK